MKRLIVISALLLLSACSQLRLSVNSGVPTQQKYCTHFPYDDSQTSCNLLGWQAFAYQSLTYTQAEHEAALYALGNGAENRYKRLILLSTYHETDAVREVAIDALLKIAEDKLGRFSQLFTIIANLQKTALENQKTTKDLQAKLKKMTKKNTALTSQLADTKAKIQAIMDIEKNLSTN